MRDDRTREWYEKRDLDWLISELLLRDYQLASEKKATRDAYRYCHDAHGSILHKLNELAPGNTTRKTVPIDAVRAIWEEASGRTGGGSTEGGGATPENSTRGAA